MEKMRIMVTGGAGFIGRALVEQLVAEHKLGGYVEAVSVVDSLVPQVHPQGRQSPDWLAELIHGTDCLQAWCTDVRDEIEFFKALLVFQPTHVIHLAAEVGVGQSQYEIAKYTSANVTGTANVLNRVLAFNDAVISEEEVAQVEAMRDNAVAAHERASTADLPTDPSASFLGERTLTALLSGQALIELDDEGFTVGDLVNKVEIGDYPVLDCSDPRELTKKLLKEAADTWADAVESMRMEAEQAERALQGAQARPRAPIQRVFVAGSMSSYGEGLYSVEKGDRRVAGRGGVRSKDLLEVGEWAPPTRRADGSSLYRLGRTPVGISEEHELRPSSVYAWTKAAQEDLSLMVGEARGLDVVVGRFFNVIGPGQSLSNPYTGVLAIFASRVLSGEPPLVFEDGGQVRDFVYVDDVARAIMTIVRKGEAGEVYNVGTGHPSTILELAQDVSTALAGPAPVVTGAWRVGDIRACYADVSKLRALGWEPRVSLPSAVSRTLAWARENAHLVTDYTTVAVDQLAERGLLHAPKSPEAPE